ncbi:MAG TPA: PIG-L family deacetylase [Vicinamibacterales bacterium]
MGRIRNVLALMGTVVLGAVGLVAPVWAQARQGQPVRTLLAVFAHPDDETIAGPLLARYGREAGTRVVLVIVTNGDKGVTPFANIPAGPELAAARTKEAECACKALGAEPPVVLGFPDGGIDSPRVLADVAGRLREVVAREKPDAIVTWGPDGGYGHQDHRLVSAVVTQLVQAGDATDRLFYAGLPKSRLESEAVKALRFPAPFTPVLDARLTVRVPYTPGDAARARDSLRCHATQFTPQAMELISALTEKIHGGQMHLRHWADGTPRSDVFED